MFQKTMLGGLVLGFLVGTAAADEAPPGLPDAAGGPMKIEYAKVRSKVLPGDKIGHAEGGWFCLDAGDMKASDHVESVFDMEAGLAFKKVARAQDLTVAAQDVSAFDTSGPVDSDYRVGGVVTSVDNNVCSYPGGRKGSLRIEVKWDLFSTRQQRIVFSRTTVGTYSAESFENTSGRDFEVKEFESALTQLFTDPDVRKLLAGVAPPEPSKPASTSLHISPTNIVVGTTAQSTEALKSAVVTILTDGGMGSGFYIADGYILTNRHVVGTSKFVKVKLATSKELVGEVVREDGARDVALLKTESAGVPAIRLRLSAPVIGEEVWAVGSPLSQQFAGTFTRGVLSGVRETDGVRFLQSDVAVNPGNSGGPLLDAQGNVVGLTTLKVKAASGIAFFVPIRDAVERLSLVVDPITTGGVVAADTPPTHTRATAH